MKQRITIEQLQELSDEQKELLREWWQPEIGDLMLTGIPFSTSCEYLTSAFDSEHIKKNNLPVLSIGQMIELIEACYSGKIGLSNTYNSVGNFVTTIHIDIPQPHRATITHKPLFVGFVRPLCDALWEAVKEII